MTELSDIDFDTVREIYCEGGDIGFRTVYAFRNEIAQPYFDDPTSMQSGPADLLLEGGDDVTFYKGRLVVVVTGEELVPLRVQLSDGDVMALSKD